ncbi:MAG: molybdopterin synthase sulfur carrier subunit [Kiritimatiellia bacterium]|jgi:sulfur-carrier protein
MNITILYFGQLAELAGKPEEVRTLTSDSLETLYADLSKAYGFKHAFHQVQVAVNHELSAHDTALKDRDLITFLPPMSGG